MRIRVLVADDQPMVRAGFRMLLADEEDIDVVAEASSGVEAVQEAARVHPTVGLMDSRMPRPHGQRIAAIRTVAAGDALLSPAITKRVIKQFTRVPHPAPPKEFGELTAREQEVFRLIARGLSNAEIGQELYIGETTVKTHMTHILQKFNLRDRVQLIVLAYQTGISEAGAQ